MATTFTRLLVHIVFSTKNRAELIRPENERDLYGYLKGIAKNHDSPVLEIGGTTDHSHYWFLCRSVLLWLISWRISRKILRYG